MTDIIGKTYHELLIKIAQTPMLVNQDEIDYCVKIVAECETFSYLFATQIIHGVFVEGEKAIFSDSYYTKYYIDFLIENNQIDKSTIFDYDNSTRTFLGKFLDEKI